MVVLQIEMFPLSVCVSHERMGLSHWVRGISSASMAAEVCKYDWYSDSAGSDSGLMALKCLIISLDEGFNRNMAKFPFSSNLSILPFMFQPQTWAGTFHLS